MVCESPVQCLARNKPVLHLVIDSEISECEERDVMYGGISEDSTASTGGQLCYHRKVRNILGLVELAMFQTQDGVRVM